MEFITLENKDTKKLVDGVILHPLKINEDESGGILVETLRKDWKEIYGDGREFFMQYYSVTPQNAARDEKEWHIHPNYQEDRFLVVQGSIVTAVADTRENSPTYGLLNLFHMEAYKDPYIILIPKGTLHGFIALSKEPSILLNFPTGIYNPNEEKRIPHEEASIKLEDDQIFNWNLVRNKFGLSSE